MQRVEIIDPAQAARTALLVVYHRRRLIGVVFGVAVALALLLTILMKPVYRADAKILVSVNREQLSSGAGTLRTNTPTQVSEQDLNSIVSILEGRDLVQDALRGLSSDAADADRVSVGGVARTIISFPVDVLGFLYRRLHGVPSTEPLDRQVESLHNRIEIRPVRRSNVIEIAFEDQDPQWASRFLNSFVASYLARHSRTFEPAQAEEFFEQQSALVLRKLEASEEALKEFRDRAGIVSLESQKNAVVSALAAAEAAYDGATVELAVAERRIAALDAELRREQPRILTTERNVQNTALQDLKAQLMALEVKRADLATRYAPQSDRLREVERQINTARSVLSEENLAPFQEREITVNPTYQFLHLDRAKEQAQLSALASRKEALERQIPELRRRLVALDANGLELERLERQVRVDEESYMGYARRQEAARLENALNRSQILNVSVAEPATTPVSPVRPRPFLNLVLGALLGLFAGVSIAFVREYLEGTVRSAADVERSADLEVLTVIETV